MQLPPTVNQLVVQRQKAELDLTKTLPPQEALVIRPPDPPPPALVETHQIQRSLDGVPLPKATGVPTWVDPVKEHAWGVPAAGGSTLGHLHAPSWLNNSSGGGPTCGVCGVTLVDSGRADGAGADYTYRDAEGVMIRSQNPLPCPVFIGKSGQLEGSVLDGKVKIRKLTNAMYGVTYQIEGIEERVARLERENDVLREAVSRPIDADALVSFLASVVEATVREKLKTVPVMVEGTQYALPEPVANMIIQVAAQPVTEHEKILARRATLEEQGVSDGR